MLGCYRIGRFKSEKGDLHPLEKKNSNIQIFIAQNLLSKAKKAAKKGQAFAETQLSIFDLVNAPSNKKLPSDLAKWAIKSGEKNGYSVKVFNKKEIEKLGLHALLAVNRGSEYPPTFLVMEYEPKKKKKRNAKR